MILRRRLLLKTMMVRAVATILVALRKMIAKRTRLHRKNARPSLMPLQVPRNIKQPRQMQKIPAPRTYLWATCLGTLMRIGSLASSKSLESLRARISSATNRLGAPKGESTAFNARNLAD